MAILYRKERIVLGLPATSKKKSNIASDPFDTTPLAVEVTEPSNISDIKADVQKTLYDRATFKLCEKSFKSLTELTYKFVLLFS